MDAAFARRCRQRLRSFTKKSANALEVQFLIWRSGNVSMWTPLSSLRVRDSRLTGSLTCLKKSPFFVWGVHLHELWKLMGKSREAIFRQRVCFTRCFQSSRRISPPVAFIGKELGKMRWTQGTNFLECYQSRAHILQVPSHRRAKSQPDGLSVAYEWPENSTSESRSTADKQRDAARENTFKNQWWLR